MTGVDAHFHLSDGRLDRRLLVEGERLGIGRFIGSCLGGFEHYPTAEDVRAYNKAMRGAARTYPGVVEGLCYVNPRHGTAALDELRRCLEDGGMLGVKLWVATLCDDPLVFPIVEQAIALRAPLLVHAWRKTVGQLPDESTAVNVAALAARYPEARIIMAHLGGQVESALDTVAPYENVYADTSGTIISAGQVELAVQRLGAGRVIFGSDAQGACLAANVGAVLGAGLTDDDLERIMGGTATRLLGEVVR